MCDDGQCKDLINNSWYLDDGALAGPKAAVLSALNLFTSLGPQTGIRINLSKSLLHSQAAFYLTGTIFLAPWCNATASVTCMHGCKRSPGAGPETLN